ncbi:hypothetical protein J1614_003020 [Plenodomus biglobosus]|nr:hypothetical protein J1614_003020 [Plenodomus biglobosus]
MESTIQDANRAYEPYNDPIPAESVFFITILPVPSSETSVLNGEVAALVYAMPTELLHTGAWITIKVEDTDGERTLQVNQHNCSYKDLGGYVWALPDSDVELGLDVEPVVTTAPVRYEPEVDEVVLTLASEDMALSIHGDTLIEPSLAGSTQVGSILQE